MTDTAKADAIETADATTAEPEQAETTETFAEMAVRLFATPAPSYGDPVVITSEMRQEMNAAASEYDEAHDQAALIQFHAKCDREWGAVVAREQAAKLAS